MVQKDIQAITQRIIARSQESRDRYLEDVYAMRGQGRARDTLSCGNLAHAFAACNRADKRKLTDQDAGGPVADIAIVSAYNDMLSAHQPYHRFLDEVKAAVAAAGGVAQMAGGVPAMCDGVTQGQPGMELSLFSRDVIAMATALAMTHNVFDGGMLFGVCDKIVPGLLIGALSFGHLPFVFVPAGPMPTGISNTEKAKVRQAYATGEVGRDQLLESESKAYHSPGTCTFYGTANSNQMMLEMMGLQLPGSSFVAPGTSLRDQLNAEAARVVVEAAKAEAVVGLGEIVSAEAVVNGIVGLLATGGSTNHTLHIPAIAAAAGWQVTWQDFSDLSDLVPLIARVYPNGLADINAFHAAGGTPYVMRELLTAGYLNGDAQTITGQNLSSYAVGPILEKGTLSFIPPVAEPLDDTILRPCDRAFQNTGGLKLLAGNLGEAVIKVSAVKPEHQFVEAPAIVFDTQDDLLTAFKAGELERDFIAVVRFQGPKANGMPELHKLTPSLGVLQDKGFKVALVTDGRMSGASGKVPAAIHVSPEASEGGMIGRIQTGDMIRLDAVGGSLEVAADLASRDVAAVTQSATTFGRGLFAAMRDNVGLAHSGASQFGQLRKK
ncbi:phosphogluconate dehydratase [Kordiimonas sediminis]|uniref:Phosphogluconate dehydratase n=1 Tax=Kordiimonas sediminis TaxID=1735581 RepID=A0A919AKR7_9PROT|nr:phosphogluconate dehydratase [Kordiimonas sediminis]GHF13418.1 phosphogluconate dehydratase [Kordiimonas sediminis]